MKKRLIPLFLILSTLLCALPLQITRNGKTDYVIIYTQLEKQAAEELKLHLEKISSAKFQMIPEAKARNNKKPAFYVGKTAFAQKQIDFSKFSDQESLVKVSGKDVIVTGGRTRGTLYAVYDLLRKEFNCRWFSYDVSDIPVNKNLQIKTALRRAVPSFSNREILDDTYPTFWHDKKLYRIKQDFKRRNAGSLSHGKYYMVWPEASKLPGECHNVYRYIDPRKYFKDHPEYFSMDKNGKRFHGKIGREMQGGNFCLSSKGAQEIVYNSLVRFIEKDRATIPREKWPVIYEFSQNDNIHYICLCPECKKMKEREGSESGALLNFLNPIAEKIAKKYPEVIIRTFAYSSSTKLAPKTIRPADNILIRWCNLYSFNDCYRPITHPINAGQKQQFDDWTKTGAKLAVWLYWNMGGQFFNPPRMETMVDAIAPELRYYKKNNVQTVFVEAYKDQHNPQNFYHLQIYVGSELIRDINQDENKLIADFMKHFYGPAEKPMTRYLNMLREGVRNVKHKMVSPSAARSYTDEKFMQQVWKELVLAQKLTAPGSVYRKHVEEEMITPLYTILKNSTWKFDNRKEMEKLYTSLRKELIAGHNPAPRFQKRFKDRLEADLRNFITLNIPVPRGFENKRVIMRGWPQFSWSSKNSSASIVDDPDSIVGKALISPPGRKKNLNRHSPVPGAFVRRFTSLDFGVYDYSTRSSIGRRFNKNIPQDEKYHWYKIGKAKLEAGSFLWGFYWGMNCRLGDLYQRDDGLPEDTNVWEIWVSFKVTGPRYVKGSTKKDELYMDQVMLVKDK